MLINSYTCKITEIYRIHLDEKDEKYKPSELSQDFEAHDTQTKNNLDSQNIKLNANFNQKLQINTGQKKIEEKCKKEIKSAKVKRDIVRSFLQFKNFD